MYQLLGSRNGRRNDTDVSENTPATDSIAFALLEGTPIEAVDGATTELQQALSAREWEVAQYVASHPGEVCPASWKLMALFPSFR